MLFYVKCPSCSRIISYDLDKYHDDLENILNDPKKTKRQKDELGSKLLEKYGYKQICCRIRIMGLIPYHKIIVT
ncbi:RNA polymerase subunit N [Tupanvirus soda lake]|uniref:RNA polymerase subunit N n=2 Tax=Tupanvirus TaxID=2094720 RepID=A0A6N1P289_9VIRU|nr:RNA polymerase subunit N [Tupanvirus soda lake]QKU35141.1 RNA polymerase subunit N [Tupanvirus soda lake]